MTCRAAPGQDTLRRIIFQLQHPGWHLSSPVSGPSADGRRHATNGTINLTADSLAALLDQLDWIHAT